MILLAALIILLHSLVAMLLASYYFRHYPFTRPPIGVINLTDVLVMLVSVVLAPYLYLVAPNWLMVGLLGLAAVGLVQMTLAPLLRANGLVWLLTVLLIGADGVSAWVWGAGHVIAQAINNLVMLLMVVGISNLWAQSGMKARDVTILGMLLALYDFIFTTQLPLMSELFQRMAQLPLAAQLAWPVAGGNGSSVIGLGDLILLAVFPLLMAKAFGRLAARLAFILGFAACVGLDGVLWWTATGRVFPVMVILGPLMVLQYGLWLRHSRRERTTAEYLAADPLPTAGS